MPLKFRLFFVVLAALCFFSPQVAHATTGYTPISSSAYSCGANVNNCSNVLVEDGVGATNSASYMYVYSTQYTVNTNTTLSSLSVNVKANHIGTSGGGVTIDLHGCSGSPTWNAQTIPSNTATYYFYEKHLTAGTIVCSGLVTIDVGISWQAGNTYGIDFIEFKPVWNASESESALTSIFIPTAGFDSAAFDSVKTSLLSKAPFAYIAPIFLFISTDPATSSALPAFTLTINSLGTPVSGGIDGSFTYLYTLFDVFKNVIRFFLYFGFIVYIVLLIRRLLPQ